MTNQIPETVPNIGLIPVTVSYPASATGGTMTIYVQLGLAVHQESEPEEVIKPEVVEILDAPAKQARKTPAKRARKVKN